MFYLGYIIVQWKDIIIFLCFPVTLVACSSEKFVNSWLEQKELHPGSIGISRTHTHNERERYHTHTLYVAAWLVVCSTLSVWPSQFDTLLKIVLCELDVCIKKIRKAKSDTLCCCRTMRVWAVKLFLPLTMNTSSICVSTAQLSDYMVSRVLNGAWLKTIEPLSFDFVAFCGIP